MSVTAEIKFNCPVCKKDLSVQVERMKVIRAERNPVPIVVTHGQPEHALTLFIDKEFRLRATSGSDIVQRVQDAELKRRPFVKRFVPFPKAENVSLGGLDYTQITIVALADGKRSIEELAEILEIPEMRVKIVCEQLVRLGKLDSVRVVME